MIQRTVIAPGIVQLLLNSPKTFNSLSFGMLDSLLQSLHQVSSDESVRVVTIRGSGKSFCSGHDLVEMTSNSDLIFYKSLFKKCTSVMTAIQNLPQPVIAGVHGVATAAGCQLVSMCDLAVASQDSKFAVSGINLGLFCATPSVGLSRNVGRKKAMEMLLTGDFISAESAMSAGLINRVVPYDELDEAIMKMALKIAQKPPVAVRFGKSLFYSQLEADGLATAYSLAEEVMAQNMMHPSAQEGFSAFLEKRPPSWKS